MEKKFKNMKTFEQHSDKNLNISDVMNLLSNDVAIEESERKAMRIGNGGKLKRDGIYANTFEMGFLHARKILLDYLRQ